MRKIVLIFILLLSYSAYSQEKIGTFDKVLTPLVKISNSITAPVPSINLLYGLVNHLYWNNMRIDNDSTVYATQYDINKKWAKEAAADAENSWSLPFVLKPTTVIIYNGIPLRSTQWTGVGLSTLNVSLDVRKYDYLTIIN